MADEDDRTEEQVFHDTLAGFPTIMWGMVTSSLDKGEKSVREYQDEITELANDAIRLMNGRVASLVLLGDLSDLAAELLRELAKATGRDAHDIAQARALEAAQRKERWRQSRPK